MNDTEKNEKMTLSPSQNLEIKLLQSLNDTADRALKNKTDLSATMIQAMVASIRLSKSDEKKGETDAFSGLTSTSSTELNEKLKKVNH